MFKFDPIQNGTGRKFGGAYNQISMKYLSNIQVGTRRKFGGAYKNERGKTFIVVSYTMCAG